MRKAMFDGALSLKLTSIHTLSSLQGATMRKLRDLL